MAICTSSVGETPTSVRRTFRTSRQLNGLKNPPPLPTSIADIDDLANQIFATGLRKLDGDILGDDSLYKWTPYPPDWSWDDLVWGYGAPVSALTIHDNALQATIAPGKSDFSPKLPYYTESNHVGVIIGGGKRDCDTLNVSISASSKLLTIEGALPDKAAPCAETIAIANPAEYAALALKAALEAKGISVSGKAKSWHYDAETGIRSPISADALPPAYPGPGLGSGPRETGCIDAISDGPDVTVAARHYSPNLAVDVNLTNKVSQNLHAELMLRNIALLDCDGSNAYPKVVREFLINAGIDPRRLRLLDGSGLSSHDLVTPRATARLLQFATTQPWFADVESLAPRRRRGRHPWRPLRRAAAQRPSLRQNRNPRRSARAFRLPRCRQRTHRHLLHHGRQPPPRHQRRPRRHGQNRRGHPGGGMKRLANKDCGESATSGAKSPFDSFGSYGTAEAVPLSETAGAAIWRMRKNRWRAAGGARKSLTKKQGAVLDNYFSMK